MTKATFKTNNLMTTLRTEKRRIWRLQRPLSGLQKDAAQSHAKLLLASLWPHFALSPPHTLFLATLNSSSDMWCPLKHPCLFTCHLLSKPGRPTHTSPFLSESQPILGLVSYFFITANGTFPYPFEGS